MRNRLSRLRWRIGRFLTNLAYRFRILRLPSTRAVKSSTTIATLAMMGFAIFLLAGGTYDALEAMAGTAIAILQQSGGGYTFLYPGDIHTQTTSESLVAGLLYFVGMAGLYMLLRSTRLVYRPRQAYLLLILGLLLTGMTVYYITFLLTGKTGGA
jgi:hypothetical protein